jgi:hypothetical protein
MDEAFELPVTYKGDELLFEATLVVTGYTHKFIVNVKGQEIIFEPDEERNYRAVLNYEDLMASSNIDMGLLQKIAEAIEGFVK